MALTVRDADAMIAASRKNRRLLAVAQVMRFVSPYIRARKEVDSGRIGRPRIVVARRLSRPYWRRRRARPFRDYGEPLLELLIHDIDVANWFMGRPQSVLASGVVGASGVAEHFLVGITYPGGKAFVEGSAMMPQGFPFATALRVQGDRGVLDLLDQFLQGPIPVETFHVYEEDGRKSLRVGGRDPYELECAAFVRSVETGKGPLTKSALAEREALRVAEAARKSLRAHGEVRL
jgi:predicted dehydrogenase